MARRSSPPPRFTFGVAIAALGACAPGDPATGAPPPSPALGPADAVGAADLDGDGHDELVLVQEGVARWPGGEQALGGHVQAVARAAPGGGRGDQLLLGTGFGRGFSDAPARVWVLASDGARLAWERRGARNQITELCATPEGVWLAAFSDERLVQGGWLRPEGAAGWRFETATEVPLGMRQLPVDGGVIVGRLYGDEPRSDGDLALHAAGTRTALPSLRGVRSLAAADLDGDGAEEVLVGDGWHFRYGTEARARLRLLVGPGWQEARAVAEFDGEYTVRDVAAVGRGLDAWLLVTGSAQVHCLRRDAFGWRAEALGPLVEPGNAVAARVGGREGVLIAGGPARWVPIAAGGQEGACAP